MSAARLSFPFGPGHVTFDQDGLATSVVHRDVPRLSYLSGAAVTALTVDGSVLPIPAPEVLADVDEVEFVATFPGRLRLVVRHTFAAGWGVRLAWTSLAAAPQLVERVQLRLAPGPGCVAWALALGVTSTYTLASADGRGPLLGGTLRCGSVDRVTDSGLELSPFELRPGARSVQQLLWEWYPSPRQAAERFPESPSALTVTTAETIHVRVDEDVAVVAAEGVEVTQAEDRLDVVSERPGTFGFELRSARGTMAFDLRWVAPVEDLLLAAVPAMLSRPRTAAGVIRLHGVAEALVVQSALARNQLDDPDDAAEGLDLFTARLVGPDGAGPDGTGREGAAPPAPLRGLSPLQAAYLCREYDRLGDGELLAEASRAVLAQSVPRPGLGVAATQLCLGLIVSGQPVEPVLQHLLGLASADAAHWGGRPSVSDRAAELEVLAVTRAGPGAAGALTAPSVPTRQIAALGLHLGAGLKGRAVSPLPVEVLSHLIAVLQLLPDGLSAGLTRLWGCSAHALARRATPELLARLEGQPVGEAHAWLVLALQTS